MSTRYCYVDPRMYYGIFAPDGRRYGVEYDTHQEATKVIASGSIRIGQRSHPVPKGSRAKLICPDHITESAVGCRDCATLGLPK